MKTAAYIVERVMAQDSLRWSRDADGKNTPLVKRADALALCKQTWNEAIEAAALIVCPIPEVEEERRCQDIAAAIRAKKVPK